MFKFVRSTARLARRRHLAITSARPARIRLAKTISGVGVGAFIIAAAQYQTTAKAQELEAPPVSPDTKYQFPTGKLLDPKNTKAKEQIVLVACGSFNPITNMHLRLLEMAKDYFEGNGYEVIGGYISPVSIGYGKKGLLPNKERLDMCNLAVASSDWLMVDSWETTFPLWTRTFLVLRHFTNEVNKAKKPVGAPVRSVLVCGSDLLDSFSTPNLWSEDDMRGILRHHGAACVSREGSSPENIVWNNDLLYDERTNIHILRQYIPNDISSTRIRHALSRGMSIKYLLPDTVVEYIKKNNLYRRN